MLFEDTTYRECAARVREEVAAMPHPADVLADITTLV
jgi:hypothetical protein